MPKASPERRFQPQLDINKSKTARRTILSGVAASLGAAYLVDQYAGDDVPAQEPQTQEWRAEDFLNSSDYKPLSLAEIAELGERQKRFEYQRPEIPPTLHDFFDRKNEGWLDPDAAERVFKADWDTEAKELERGVLVFHDIGQDWYKVREGDTLDSIRATLASHKDYKYLAEQGLDEDSGNYNRLMSFNIAPADATPERALKPGSWLPIPQEYKSRVVDDEQFSRYAYTAIDEMLTHPIYGRKLAGLLKTMSEVELVAHMMAVAQKETGAYLGSFASPSYDSKFGVWQVSMFQVLMYGSGRDALHKLGFTEGQVTHPKNAALLFLAFMLEKSADVGVPLTSVLPVERQNYLSAWGNFYNGKLTDASSEEAKCARRKYNGETRERYISALKLQVDLAKKYPPEVDKKTRLAYDE